MKKLLFVLFLVALNCVQGLSQDILQVNSASEDEKIKQVRSSGLSDILSFQMLNQGLSNVAEINQIGNLNKTVVSQQYDGGSANANQVYNIQQGTNNEMTIGQVGNGNLLLGFQIGYVETEQCETSKDICSQSILEYGASTGSDLSSVEGTGNVLNVNQNGNMNGLVAVQQGSHNSIDANQTGMNNYLVIYQKGNNNEVIGFRQENNSEKTLAETIVQKGDDLSLNSTDASKSKPNGNSFIQKGVNLTIELNNQFANTLGGIEVTQQGKDMKVVIDQSYFPLLTK